jgi:hypothetical protein
MQEVPLRMYWRITDAQAMERRLRRLGAAKSLPIGGPYAQLFAWRGLERPKMLAWTPMTPTIEQRIAAEQELDWHPLARWLSVRPTLNLWGIATAWTFYWQSLHSESISAEQFTVADCPARDRLIDDLLRVSRGWLLWDFQMTLLKSMVLTGRDHSASPAVAPCGELTEDSAAMDPRTVLPNDRSLLSVLAERLLFVESLIPFPGQLAWRLLAIRQRDRVRIGAQVLRAKPNPGRSSTHCSRPSRHPVVA